MNTEENVEYKKCASVENSALSELREYSSVFSKLITESLYYTALNNSLHIYNSCF